MTSRDGLSVCGKILLLASLTVIAGGCSTAHRSVQFQPHFVSPADTRIEIGPVTSQAEDTSDVDPSGRLADLLREKLKRHRLLWPVGAKGDHLILTTTILEYRKGNWFLRDIPGLGATVLSVRGDLKDSVSGAVVGSVDVRRTIAFWHPLAFGAGTKIFGRVARDMVKELRPEIIEEGEDD